MEVRATRGQAIRLKCLDCCCGNSAEVRKCPATSCPLWRYRMGAEIRDADKEQPTTEDAAAAEEA